jgi:hypothetical protein
MTGATTGNSPSTGINLVGMTTFNAGTTTIEYTVKDPAGHTLSSSFAVTVIDNEKPVIACPTNIIKPATIGQCKTTVSVPDPVVSDNCGVTRILWQMGGATNGSSPGTGINLLGTRSFNVGTTAILYTIRDAAGNSESCQFTVTVNDVQNPIVSCPSNLVFCKKSNNTYTIPAMTRSDNCAIASTTFAITGATNRSGNGTNASGAYNLGTSTIKWTVTDVSGNVSTCSTVVQVVPQNQCGNTRIQDPGTPQTRTIQSDVYDDMSKIAPTVPGKLSIAAYPNPATSFFNLKVTSRSNEVIEIKVYDMTGKVVDARRGAPGQLYRLGDNVVGGMYIVEVRQGSEVATTKVVKQ